MYRASFKSLPEMSYAVNEALNTLYSNISFAGNDVHTIMITSCNASDGKSFLSLALARTIASMGSKVALVDCDLRKSRLVRDVIKIESGPGKGITHYLAGRATIEEALYSTNVSSLYIVPCTKAVVNSLPLLNTSRVEELLDQLSKTMDYVIVDTPPVGLLIDAAKIATYCDGTVLVVSYNETRKRELVEAVAQLEQAGSPILGTVINKADLNDYIGRKYYGKKYYSYYYRDSRLHASKAESKHKSKHDR